MLQKSQPSLSSASARQKTAPGVCSLQTVHTVHGRSIDSQRDDQHWTTKTSGEPGQIQSGKAQDTVFLYPSCSQAAAHSEDSKQGGKLW